MEIEFDRETLMNALGAVEPAIPRKTPREVLRNALLEYTVAGCHLCATDQEIQIRHEIANTVAKADGKVLLPAGMVRQILSELRSERVVLEISETGIEISSGFSEFRLPTADATEFPDVAVFEGAETFAVNAGRLKTAMRRVLFATDETSARYALGGVKFEIEGDFLLLIATDSRRLAISKIDINGHGKLPDEGNCVVPQKALVLLDRLLDDAAGSVQMCFTPNSAAFLVKGSTVTTRLVEGRFPKWQDVVPKGGKNVASCSSGVLLGAVRQSQIVTCEESRGIDFDFTENNLRLSGKAANIGSAKIEQVLIYSGDKLQITFDPRFVADALKAIGPDVGVTLAMTKTYEAALLETDDGYRYVIMPLTRDV